MSLKNLLNQLKEKGSKMSDTNIEYILEKVAILGYMGVVVNMSKDMFNDLMETEGLEGLISSMKKLDKNFDEERVRKIWKVMEELSKI